MFVSAVFTGLGVLSWIPFFWKGGHWNDKKSTEPLIYFLLGALAGLLVPQLPLPLWPFAQGATQWILGPTFVIPAVLYLLVRFFTPHISRGFSLGESGLFYLGYFAFRNLINIGYLTPDLVFWTFLSDFPLQFFLTFLLIGGGETFLFSSRRERLLYLIPIAIGVELLYPYLLPLQAQLNLSGRLLMNVSFFSAFFFLYRKFRRNLSPDKNPFVRKAMAKRSSWEDNLNFGQKCLKQNKYNLAYAHFQSALNKSPRNKRLYLFAAVGALLSQKTAVGRKYLNLFLLTYGERGYRHGKQYLAGLPLSRFEALYLGRVLDTEYNQCYSANNAG